MAAKKKKGKKASRKSVQQPKTFSTPFIKEIIKTYIQDGATKKWPPAGSGAIDAARDINAVSAVLVDASCTMLTPLAPMNVLTLAGKIQADLTARDWPEADANKLQTKYGTATRKLAKHALRMGEALAIVRYMVQVVSDLNPTGSGTGSGEKTKVPPH